MFYKQFWTKMFKLKGCTSRKDYWLTILVNLILYFVVYLVPLLIAYVLANWFNISTASLENVFLIIMPILILAYIIPITIGTITMAVRRLHDANLSGWWIFASIIPIIGLIMTLLPTVEENNKYRQ